MACLKMFSIVTVLVAGLLGYLVYLLEYAPPLPHFQLEYWGLGIQKPDDTSIKPFKIAIPQSELKVLKDRLSLTRELVAPLVGVGFSYGTNTDYLKIALKHWRNKYDWQKRESYLNSLPQYITEIGGLKIHFLHVKPDPAKTKGKKVLPLLLLHGWPGCVFEFYKMAPLLTSPRPDSDIVFEVVAPSLPGYLFSEAPSKPGLGPAQMGIIFDQLMSRLGFHEYYVQGGDWGSFIGLHLSILSPQRVLGFHSNFCLVQTPSSRFLSALAYFFPSFFMSENKIERYISQFVDTFLLESGYFHIQATKPDTIGVGLSDSPAGLAAYMLEKFSTGTNRTWRELTDGGLSSLNIDEIFDFITLYWFTNSITTSMRLYAETFNKKYYSLAIMRHPVSVPTACAQLPNEMLYYPRKILEGTYKNLISITEFPRGGHFASFEEPVLMADDIRGFVRILTAPKNQDK